MTNEIDPASKLLWEKLNRHERRKLYSELKRQERRMKKHGKKAPVR